ncbi:MAG TPA: DUF4436 family protein [Roseiarcus sp.]|jgi:hypothetical protein
MEREQRRSRTIRIATIGALLIALTISYLIILHNMHVSEQPGERTFGASDSGAAAEIYLEPLSIDAANEGMQLRAYLSPNLSNGANARAGADRELILLITHDQTVEEIKLAAGAHMASSTFEIDLNDGSVIHYPFDSFVARLDVQLMDGKAALNLPAKITVWEGVLGYNLHTTSQAGANPNDVQLAIATSRGGAIVLLALCAYGVMLVLGFCAVVIGVLTFINVRPPETGLIGSLAAFAFALPVLRGILPGSPPLGVTADMWVFLWAEMVNVLALALVVFKWAHSGPRI